MRILSVIAALALAAAAQAAESVTSAVPAVALDAHVLVDNGDLVLSDVARLDGPAGAVAAAGRAPVGAAPRVGQVLRLSRAQLVAALRRHGIGGDVAWSGADVVEVRTRSQVVAGTQLARVALDAATGAAAPGSAVTLLREVPDVEMPTCPLQLRARPLDGMGLQARGVVPVDLSCGERPYRTVQVMIEVRREREVLVATDDVVAGARVTAQTFRSTLRDVARLSAEPAPVGLRDGNRRLGRTLRAGQILTVDQLASHDAAAPGDRVRLQARAGQAAVEAAGVIVRGGVLGEHVTVRLGGGPDVVTGVLSDAATVILQ